MRMLELVATGLFWWHPALWLARQELHRAEEECCDLWVVWALPKLKRTYAVALVEAVEFLSEARPGALPIGASGMGQVEDLSRRIGMIMRGDTPRGLSRAGTLAALGLGLLLLPWRPTIAQDAPRAEDAKPAAETVKGDDAKPAAEATKQDDAKRAFDASRRSAAEEELKRSGGPAEVVGRDAREKIRERVAGGGRPGVGGPDPRNARPLPAGRRRRPPRRREGAAQAGRGH